MHVIGMSRQGKSYFLEHLIRQDIANYNGVCVIDPHGEMYANLVDWCAANDMHKKRRIHLINPASGDWSVGFNPLSVDDAFVEARVAAMIEACQKVWDDTQSTGHATLGKLLEMVFTTLAHHRLSLHEASLLTTFDHKPVRQRLVAEIGDPALSDLWSTIDTFKEFEFAHRFEAVENRLRAMVRAPGIAEMLAQTEDVIDFETCMDNGHVVLVNLAHKKQIAPQVARSLGALITADLFHSAQGRMPKKAKQRPFYCYIDECGDYLNEAVVKSLDQTAKFGLHYVLSHQRLSNLGERGDPIRAGVLGGAQSKVVFLQDETETASEMGYFLFGKDYDLEKPKEKLIRPTVVGHSREWLHGEAEGEGSFSAMSSGYTSGSSAGLSLADFDGATPVNFEGDSYVESEGSSAGSSVSKSQSKHEALIPIWEDVPHGTYSLDELNHMSVVQIRSLKKRQAFAYSADDRTTRQFATVDVTEAKPTLHQIEDFFRTIRNRESSANAKDVVRAKAKERRERLLVTSPPDEPLTFFEDQN